MCATQGGLVATNSYHCIIKHNIIDDLAPSPRGICCFFALPFKRPDPRSCPVDVNVVPKNILLIFSTAGGKLFGVAAVVLHIVHTARWVFRAQHVRWRGSGELPPVPGGTGKRGTSQAAGQTRQADGKKTEK